MIKVEQTKFGHEGNCFEACVASILEVPIEKVPGFFRTGEPISPEECYRWGDYQEDLNRNFLAPRGLYLFTQIDLTGAMAPPGYSILTLSQILETPQEGRIRITLSHAVVCKDGKVVWDPDPESRGCHVLERSPRYWVMFGSLDPSKALRKKRKVK